MHERAGSFDEWYERTHPRLVRSLLFTCNGDAELAADVVDEAMVRALERWSRVRRMDAPEAWAYRVAANQARRHYRRRRSERKALERSTPVPEWLPADESSTVWMLVARLDKRDRDAMSLRYLGGFSEREVAAALEVPEGTASAILARARQRLRDELAEPSGEDADV